MSLPRAIVAKTSWWKRYQARDHGICIYCSVCMLPKDPVIYGNRFVTQNICAGSTNGICSHLTITWS